MQCNKIKMPLIILIKCDVNIIKYAVYVIKGCLYYNSFGNLMNISINFPYVASVIIFRLSYCFRKQFSNFDLCQSLEKCKLVNRGATNAALCLNN